jgi:hypothetical protein
VSKLLSESFQELMLDEKHTGRENGVQIYFMGGLAM